MEITQYSNGTEGASNPSTQKQDDHPDAGQRLFTSSPSTSPPIAQYVGCEGLASPATDERDGIKYTFDFYHPECGKVFKVLKSNVLSEYEKYVQYPGDGFAIVNVDDHPDCQLAGCPCCGDRYVILPRELGEKLHDTDSTYVYFQGHLCEYVGDEKDGTSQWVVLDPLVLREDEDDEFDGRRGGRRLIPRLVVG